MYKVVEDMGAAMGKTIARVPSAGYGTDFGPTRAESFEYLNNGFYTRTSLDFDNLTGRKPTSYAE
jgi:hypothetical protein